MEKHDKLLQEIAEQQRQNLPNIKPKKSSLFKKITKGLIYLVVFFFILFIFFYISNKSTGEGRLSWVDKIPILGQIKQLAESSDAPLKGEDRGRINILLLGMGGKNHDGAYLTDTIIVVSLDVQTNKVAMLSIPRDMVVPVAGMGWPKINHVNSYAEAKEPGSGGRVTAEVVSQLLDAPIDYYVSLDFDGFVKIIDELGGVNVYVDNTFDDYHYPILGEEDNPSYNARFEHLHFDKGWQEMDGSLALKYARSRYAGGVEGNDFARAARQQKVIEAVKEKMLSKSTLLNPRLVASLFNDAQEHISTDLKIWEMVSLWDKYKDIKSDNIINKVLSNRPSGLLADAISADGAYTLVPRAGDFSEIKYLFNNMFYEIPDNDKQKVSEESTNLQVLNGTFVPGLAGKTATDLEKYGFKISQIANCSHQDFQSSVIYDLTYGEKKNSLEILKAKTNANVSYNLPDWLQEEIKNAVNSGQSLSRPDMILILGENANLMPLSTEDVDINKQPTDS